MEDSASFLLQPASDALADLSLEDHDLESFEVSEIESSLLSGELLGEASGSPLLNEVEGGDGVDETASSHVSGDGRDSELSEGESSHGDHLSLDVGGGAVDQNLGVRGRTRDGGWPY